MLGKYDCGVPNPSLKSHDPERFCPLGMETDKTEMDDERIKPEKVKNTKFSHYMAKLTAIEKTHPYRDIKITIKLILV